MPVRLSDPRRGEDTAALPRSIIGTLVLVIFLAFASAMFAQTRPYIGYVYPAGGQQGTTFQIKLGGQGLDDVTGVLVTGTGVSVKSVDYFRRLNPQEMQLLNEQWRELQKATSAVAAASAQTKASEEIIARIEKRQREYVQTPACASISSLVFAQVTIARNAEPGARELRLLTAKGISNPLVFHVGPLPEHRRQPMITATIQVLGKEASALRKRPAGEAEERVEIPCTLNGQIASGELNRYRFTGRRGQRLVISTQARSLIPFIADAVPGWFQPVISVRDAKGKELAFADDYYFQPDPALLFEVPADGEYVLAITDALHRGREDFIYRITAGELPFVTSVFPLGGRTNVSLTPMLRGWNVEETALVFPRGDVPPGIHWLALTRKEIFNPVPFAFGTLPDRLELEVNNTPESAQPVTPPVIINGRIRWAGDSDVFRFRGKSNATIVAEVEARRLNSPLDSVIKLTDEIGHVLAFNDDREDPGAGVNTHHADSWLMATLPADGNYFLHISDTARQGGDEYGYRLRLSAPQPDFELRVVPSSISLRTNSTASVTVYAHRKDGFARSITLTLTNAPPGFSPDPVKLPAGQTSARFTIRGPRTPTPAPVNLTLVGSAVLGEKTITREAVPAEDRMQAFLWRQLVPARELKALVFDPSTEPLVRRPAPKYTSTATNSALAVTNSIVGTNVVTGAKPRFTRSQVTRRLRELKLLFEEGALTDEFYLQKVSECEANQ